MRNYRNSDYALNKYSEGIVYRFANQIIEISMAEYLTENPDKTEQDFLELKALSDAIFIEQDRAENVQTYKNIPIHGMEDTLDSGDIPLDEQHIESQDQQYASEMIAHLLESGTLTETQRRRFTLHIVEGLSLREIAEHEGVFFTSVAESINATIKKLKKAFPEF